MSRALTFVCHQCVFASWVSYLRPLTKRRKKEETRELMQSVFWMNEILNSALNSGMALGHSSASAFSPCAPWLKAPWLPSYVTPLCISFWIRALFLCLISQWVCSVGPNALFLELLLQNCFVHFCSSGAIEEKLSFLRLSCISFKAVFSDPL